MMSGDIVWCACPGCRNHVHLDPERLSRVVLPSGWSYHLRRRGWQAECPNHDHGHSPAYDHDPSEQPVTVDGEG